MCVCADKGTEMLCRALPTNPKTSYIHLEEITLDYCTEITDKVRCSVSLTSPSPSLVHLAHSLNSAVIHFLLRMCVCVRAHMWCRPYSSW